MNTSHRHIRILATILTFSMAVLLTSLTPAAAEEPTLKWKYQVNGSYSNLAPTIGADGTIYISGEGYTGGGALYAINPNGTCKWVYETTAFSYVPPAIGPDGTIFILSRDQYLYAINPNGTLKWKWFLSISNVCPAYGMAIGMDGSICANVGCGNISVINPNGIEKWKSWVYGNNYTEPVIANDGTIYATGHWEIDAFNGDGTKKWTCGRSPWASGSHLAIGADGTIYSPEYQNLYAINHVDGAVKWIFDIEPDEFLYGIVIGPDDMIYTWSLKNLYAINKNGTQKWKIDTAGLSIYSIGGVAIGANGMLYVARDSGICAIDVNGNLKWNTDQFSGGHPAISPDGTIYIYNGTYLYAINSNSGGLSNSAWPMFQHDVRHTGRSNYIGLNIPKPTATPPIETFPQPNKLFVDSSTFVKNNGPSFSPDSQQFLNDHQNAFQRFISKFITSPDGAKNTANFWKNAFNILGNTLSVAAISADAKQSTIKGINSLLLYVDKNLFFNIFHFDSDSQLRAYIDILTYAKVPTNSYSFIFSTGSIFSEAYTFMFSLIADDPPDPNFTEVYQCPVAITSPFSLPELSQDMNKLLGLQLGSSYNTYYYLLGLTTSINRYSSALAAGDAISAGLQFEAFVKYLTLYDASAIQTAAYVGQLKQAMSNQGLPDITYTKQDILNLQNQIQLNGLPPEVITSFKTLGLTDSQISDLTQAALNYVPPDSVSGSLYSNLSDGVKQLHNASSWRPPNPALYLLLMD